jgi:4-hydroxyphenylpyruvate dioxygenase-like putative hemolysin
LEKVKNILPLNNPDAPLQVSEDKKLLQFSTKSTLYPVKFKEGAFEIPRNFIEFIERKDNREGFSEKNANVVFNSTSN